MRVYITAQGPSPRPPPPPEAHPPQDRQGGVTIKGNGFDKGSQARFFLTGTTNPGGITVKSTTSKGKKTLVANIDVAVDATIADFDIEVTTCSGRRGRGIILFSVKKKGSGGAQSGTFAAKAEFISPLGNIRDDGKTDDGSTFAYYERKHPVVQGTCSRVYVACGHDGCDLSLLAPYFRNPEECPDPEAQTDADGNPVCEGVEDYKNRIARDFRLMVLDFNQEEGTKFGCPELNGDGFEDCDSLQLVRLFSSDNFDIEGPTSVKISIDAPAPLKGGRGNPQCGLAEKWQLRFVNDLTIEKDPDDPNNDDVRILKAEPGVNDLAQLLERVTISKGKTELQPRGKFRMPFVLRITKSDKSIF